MIRYDSKIHDLDTIRVIRYDSKIHDLDTIPNNVQLVDILRFLSIYLRNSLDLNRLESRRSSLNLQNEKGREALYSAD